MSQTNFEKYLTLTKKNGQNVDFSTLYGPVYLRVDGKLVATMEVKYCDDHIYLSRGQTVNKERKQGYGTLLRGAIALAAKKAGYKYITQTSANVNHMLKNNPENSIPYSSRIMQKLGAKLYNIRKRTYEKPKNSSIRLGTEKWELRFNNEYSKPIFSAWVAQSGLKVKTNNNSK